MEFNLKPQLLDMVQTEEKRGKNMDFSFVRKNSCAIEAFAYPEEIYAGGARIFNRDGGGRTQKAIINRNA